MSAVRAAGARAVAPTPPAAASQLAEARRTLREVTPTQHWEAVQAEVHRLQGEGVPPLAALQAVYAKLASGWAPS